MECKRCNKHFEKKTYNQLFCSKRCQENYNQLNWQRHHKNNCKQCGITVKLTSSLCKKCIAQSRKIIKSTMTLGQLKSLSKRPRQWESRIRTEARDIVGEGHSCFNCNYSLHFEVCHIKPIASFDEEELVSTINSPQNLTVLCRNCHWEQEHGFIQVPSIASKEGFEPTTSRFVAGCSIR